MNKYYRIFAALTLSSGFTSQYSLADTLPEQGKTAEVVTEADSGTAAPDWTKKLHFGGLLEIDGSFEKKDFNSNNQEDEDTSDLTLSTVEIGVDADVAEHVKGHVLFLYEDDEDVVVDEAFGLIDGQEEIPLYLKAGKFYLPFGNFSSQMIADPLTKILGESRQTALETGYRIGDFHFSVFAFNGDIDTDEDSSIDNFGAAAGYEMEMDSLKLNIGVSYLNSMAESDWYREQTEEEAGEAQARGFTFSSRNYIPGLGLHALVGFKQFELTGEYICQLEEPEWNLEEIEAGSLARMGLGSTFTDEKMSAWNLEASSTVDLAGKEVLFAVGYQGSRHGEDILPESRLAAVAGIPLFSGTELLIEYRHDEFATDDTADAVTARLAIEF